MTEREHKLFELYRRSTSRVAVIDVPPFTLSLSAALHESADQIGT